jgi:membrane-bound metal-dependent hydrolase YbcI (DUF457 family)
MPLTPFHFGHALPFCFVDFKKKRVDVVSCLIGCIIVDIHAVIIFLFGLPQPLHGPVHSFLIATILGVLTGVFIHFTQNFWIKITTFFKWEQKTSLRSKIFWAVLMCYSHIFLDAFLYPEMNLWWPFIDGNPFYGVLSSSTVYLICTIGIILGIIEYILYLIWTQNKSQNSKNNPL